MRFGCLRCWVASRGRHGARVAHPSLRQTAGVAKLVDQLLRDYDLGGEFRWETLDPLTECVHSWDDAEHRFYDLKIEAERALLLEKASKFLHRLALESGPENGGWPGSGQGRGS